MKTRMKALLANTSSAIAIALLAFSFTFGGARAARADDPEALAAARPDMVLISVQALDGLEQRVSYLEEVVAALADSSHRIVSHQLCIADDAGAETCLTKLQLDALLASQVHVVETAQPVTPAGTEGTPPAKAETAASTASKPEAPVELKEISNAEPESTGSISAAAAPSTNASETPKSDELP